MSLESLDYGVSILSDILFQVKQNKWIKVYKLARKIKAWDEINSEISSLCELSHWESFNKNP